MLDKLFELFYIARNLFGMIINQIPLFKIPNISMLDYEKNVIFQTTMQTNAFFMNRENESNHSSNPTSIALARSRQVKRNEEEIIEKSRKRKLDSINNPEYTIENELYRYNLRSRRI